MNADERRLILQRIRYLHNKIGLITTLNYKIHNPKKVEELKSMKEKYRKEVEKLKRLIDFKDRSIYEDWRADPYEYKSYDEKKGNKR